jgi:Holliday junction resolvase RusA-like endonuclease
MLDDRPDLTVTVTGRPKTKGSAASFVPRRRDGSLVTRANGQPMVVQATDADAKAWAAAISDACAREMALGCVDLIRSAAVRIELTFVLPRGKGHFGTGRNAGLLKDSAPAFPAVRPDVDKLTRNVLDAMKGVVYGDDGQVTELLVRKVFGEPARLEIGVWRLPGSVGEMTLRAAPELLSEAQGVGV